eukprot:1159333-Pelagomonas_calceolata.AAC.4
MGVCPPHALFACSFRKKLSQVTKWLEDHKIPERTQKQVQVGGQRKLEIKATKRPCAIKELSPT